MRQYLCECQICKLQHNVSFPAAPYPEFGESFDVRCKCCHRATPHQRVLTRKTLSELHRNQAENELRKSIEDECSKYGFQYRFFYESVVVTTPYAYSGASSFEGDRLVPSPCPNPGGHGGTLRVVCKGDSVSVGGVIV